MDKHDNRETRVLIGHFTVDSGQFIIGDPCYLSSWESDEFKDVRIYRNLETEELLRFHHDFSHYEQPIAAQGGKTMNALVASGLWVKVEPPLQSAYSYSYDGACGASMSRLGGGVLGGGDAVASRTACGDGEYPVYRVFGANGDLLRVEICFDEEEEEEDE